MAVTAQRGADIRDDTETSRASDPPALTRGSVVAIGIVQLLLAPALFFIGFGFLFVGAGINPDSTTVGVGEGIALALYGVVALTVLMLLTGGVTLLAAGKSSSSRWVRRAAYVPLGFAGASVIILVGLGIAG